MVDGLPYKLIFILAEPFCRIHVTGVARCKPTTIVTRVTRSYA
ncbi:hypothetical protein [Escherichia phage TR2]|nr:hypothetical protein [Escherichia phage TR2]